MIDDISLGEIPGHYAIAKAKVLAQCWLGVGPEERNAVILAGGDEQGLGVAPIQLVDDDVVEDEQFGFWSSMSEVFLE
ncbi:hypothetical protein LA080_004386 [Diaporthe eres]|nr:hypothetical protein LA080_004386 [Diaporthe eres]